MIGTSIQSAKVMPPLIGTAIDVGSGEAGVTNPRDDLKRIADEVEGVAPYMRTTSSAAWAACGAQHPRLDAKCYRPTGHSGDHQGWSNSGNINLGSTRWCPCNEWPSCPLCEEEKSGS